MGGMGAMFGGGPAMTNAVAEGGKKAGASMAASITKAGAGVGGKLRGVLGKLGVGAGGLVGGVAIASATIAIEQASLLAKDLDTQRKDIADEVKNLVEVAEARGEKFATRKRSLAERMFSPRDPMDPTEIFEEEEVAFRDQSGKIVRMGKKEFDARPEPVKVDQDPTVMTVAGRRRAEEGARRTEAARAAAREDVSEGFGGWEALEARQAAREKAAAALAATLGGGGGKGELQVQGIDALRSAVEAGPTKTLRVELTNADAVGEAVASRSGSKPGTPPAAGHTGG